MVSRFAVIQMENTVSNFAIKTYLGQPRKRLQRYASVALMRDREHYIGIAVYFGDRNGPFELSPRASVNLDVVPVDIFYPF